MKGLKSEELMAEWQRVLGQKTSAVLKKREMLVLDTFNSHLTEKVETLL